MTYSEVIQIPRFIDRFRALAIGGSVGEETFGWDRYLNQTLYRSKEWQEFRNQIIVRDSGCDLASPDYPIGGRIIVHHITPICKADIINRSPMIFDPENVICVSHITHEAIHYGSEDLLIKDPVERSPGDTKLW